MTTLLRINKYLAEQGYCSRREADGLIRAGKVFVNGKRAWLGDQVSDADRVEVLDRRPKSKPSKIYLILNKPAGYVSTTDRRAENTIMSLVPPANRLFPVGRLDTHSSGLILMTNDGELANQLTHPRYKREEEYDVTLDKPITDSHLRRIVEGTTKRLDKRRFLMTLREGTHIRRLCDELGYTVTALERIRMGSLRLDNLPSGKTRPLTDREITTLKTSDSTQ